jgi:hypothetical protein
MVMGATGPWRFRSLSLFFSPFLILQFRKKWISLLDNMKIHINNFKWSSVPSGFHSEFIWNAASLGPFNYFKIRTNSISKWSNGSRASSIWYSNLYVSYIQNWSIFIILQPVHCRRHVVVEDKYSFLTKSLIWKKMNWFIYNQINF